MARTRTAEADPFLLAAALVGVGGCLLAAATPVVAGASIAFTGSVATSGALGLVFAGRNLQLLRRDGSVALAPATLTTAFGAWFTAAPLLYEVGALTTAGVQTAGILALTFGLYTVVAGLADGR
ncbi:MAG: hypothetical protein ABEJ05_13280 [Haloglomus sp.]